MGHAGSYCTCDMFYDHKKSSLKIASQWTQQQNNIPHEVDHGCNVGDRCVVPSKDLCPWGAVPSEPLPILLGQLSRSTRVEDVFIETTYKHNNEHDQDVL